MKTSFMKKWGLVFVLSLSLMVIIIDTTMINVSIRNIVVDLNTSLKNVQWAITIYSLIMAAFMLIGGKIGDVYGRKKTFIIGTLIYGIGTIVAALSPNITILMIGWSIIEGVGAALMMPATISLLLANYKGDERNIGFGIWGGVAGSAASIGPLYGGYMTTNFSWRWAFASEIIFVILILGLSFFINESKAVSKNKRLDILGMILSSVGLGAIVYGLIEASTYGWWTAKEIYMIGNIEFSFYNISITPIFISIGIILIFLFILWQRIITYQSVNQQKQKEPPTPLLNVELFINKQCSTGLVTLYVLALVQAGLFFTIPVFLQVVGGYNAFDTGVALLPMSVMIFIASLLFSKIGTKISPKFIIQTGIIIVFISTLLLKNTLRVDIQNQNLYLELGLFGLGFGMIMSQITNLILSAAPIDQAGEASGLTTTIRTLGSSFGTAIIGTVLVSSLVFEMNDQINQSSVIPEVFKEKISQEVEKSSQQMGETDALFDQTRIPPLISREILHIKDNATVEANKNAMNYIAWFSLTLFFVSFFIPSVKKSNEQKNSNPEY